jgi:hypothetical protein
MNLELIEFFRSMSFLPVLVAACIWNKLEKAQKYFGLFLLWGALNDSKALFFEDVEFRRKLYVFYALTEVVFVVWFILHIGKMHFPKILSRLFFVLIIPFWAIAFFILEDSYDNDHFSPLFDAITAGFISILAALRINKLTQTNKLLHLQSEFWFCGGIFLYFFCNIFIFSVINDKIIDNAWFIHNSFHSMAMLIYTLGFISIGYNFGIKKIA